MPKKRDLTHLKAASRRFHRANWFRMGYASASCSAVGPLNVMARYATRQYTGISVCAPAHATQACVEVDHSSVGELKCPDELH